MKKCMVILVILFSVLMCACDGMASEDRTEGDAALNPEIAMTATPLPTATPEPTKAPRQIAESYPVVALDNEYVTITILDKFHESDIFYMDFGYNILIENKCDKHIMVVPTNCSKDGFMLSLSETPHIDAHTIAPNKKAQTQMFYMNAENNAMIKTVDDLINFDGQWQLAFSSDGSTWNDFVHCDFAYILP